MKKCINPACNAELEDYMDRCPECGVAQKRVIVTEKEPEVRNPIRQEKESLSPMGTQQVVQRHWFITAWLIFVIIVNVLAGIIQIFPKEMFGRAFSDAYGGISIFSGVMCFINVLGAVLLLNWRKLGFYIFIIVSVIGSFAVLITMSQFPHGLVGVVILWFVLQIRKDGISYWKAMK